MASRLTMSKTEREQFLADVHVAVLVIDTSGGPPLATPVWYRYTPGGDVQFTTDADSVKVARLRSAGHASLCVQREELPYAYVTVEGPVTIGDASEEDRIYLAVRYLGEELGRGYVESTKDTAVVLVSLAPQRWRTTDYAKLPATPT